MDFNQAKSALKRGYSDAGIEIVAETDDEIAVKFAGDTFFIRRNEIDQFGANRDALIDASVAPTDCSYCSPTTREQLVRPVDPVRSRMLMSFGTRHFTFRRVGTDNPSIQIGPASDQFVDFFRFEKSYLALCARRGRRTLTGIRGQTDETFRDFLYRPTTVRVSGLEQETT